MFLVSFVFHLRVLISIFATIFRLKRKGEFYKYNPIALTGLRKVSSVRGANIRLNDKQKL